MLEAVRHLQPIREESRVEHAGARERLLQPLAALLVGGSELVEHLGALAQGRELLAQRVALLARLRLVAQYGPQRVGGFLLGALRALEVRMELGRAPLTLGEQRRHRLALLDQALELDLVVLAAIAPFLGLDLLLVQARLERRHVAARYQ